MVVLFYNIGPKIEKMVFSIVTTHLSFTDCGKTILPLTNTLAYFPDE
jgi:hypothetical protein